MKPWEIKAETVRGTTPVNVRAYSFIVPTEIQPIRLTTRYEPRPMDGVLEVDISLWDRLPRRGQTTTFSMPPHGQPSTLTVRYRRRYPDRGIVRLWVTTAPKEGAHHVG